MALCRMVRATGPQTTLQNGSRTATKAVPNDWHRWFGLGHAQGLKRSGGSHFAYVSVLDKHMALCRMVRAPASQPSLQNGSRTATKAVPNDWHRWFDLGHAQGLK